MTEPFVQPHVFRNRRIVDVNTPAEVDEMLELVNERALHTIRERRLVRVVAVDRLIDIHDRQIERLTFIAAWTRRHRE